MSWLRSHFAVLRALLPSLVVLLLLTFAGLAVHGTQESTNASIRSLVVNGCRRLNVKQREDNRNQFADYQFDSEFLILILRSPPRSSKRQAELRLFTGPLRAAVRSKAWVPPVGDCRTVGAHYRLPHAIPFTQQLPPPSAIDGP